VRAKTGAAKAFPVAKLPELPDNAKKAIRLATYGGGKKQPGCKTLASFND